jgi:hypothetical protein
MLEESNRKLRSNVESAISNYDSDIQTITNSCVTMPVSTTMSGITIPTTIKEDDSDIATLVTNQFESNSRITYFDSGVVNESDDEFRFLDAIEGQATYDQGHVIRNTVVHAATSSTTDQQKPATTAQQTLDSSSFPHYKMQVQGDTRSVNQHHANTHYSSQALSPSESIAKAKRFSSGIGSSRHGAQRIYPSNRDEITVSTENVSNTNTQDKSDDDMKPAPVPAYLAEALPVESFILAKRVPIALPETLETHVGAVNAKMCHFYITDLDDWACWRINISSSSEQKAKTFATEWFSYEWFSYEWFGYEWFGYEWFGYEWFGNDSSNCSTDDIICTNADTSCI